MCCLPQKRRSLLQTNSYEYTGFGNRFDDGFYIAQETLTRRRRLMAAAAEVPPVVAAPEPTAQPVTVVGQGPTVVRNESLPTMKVASGTTTVRFPRK